jgi:hypothetical protein
MDKISSGNLSDIHSLYESIHHETSEAEVLNEYAGQAPVASPSKPRFGPTQAQQAQGAKTQLQRGGNVAMSGGTGHLNSAQTKAQGRTVVGFDQTKVAGPRGGTVGAAVPQTQTLGGQKLYQAKLGGKTVFVGAKPTSGAPAAKPAQPAAGAPQRPQPSASAPRPPADSPGGAPGGPKVVPAGGAKPVGSAMDQWAKANPKLAAAAAEKARIRGTAQTDNPLMKDMRSKMPMTPSVQSPTLAKDLGKGSGNQSLLNNPNAAKAAPPAAPTTPSLGQRAMTSPTPGASAFRPSTVNVATQPNQGVAPITNRIAAQNSAAQNAGSTYGARAFQTQSFNYDDMYETILEYLIDEGHAESLYEAEYIMTEMEPGIMADIFEAKYGTAKGRHKLALKVSKGQDVGAAGGGFEKIVAKQSKKYGKKRATKIAAAAMWKNLAKE